MKTGVSLKYDISDIPEHIFPLDGRGYLILDPGRCKECGNRITDWAAFFRVRCYSKEE